MNVTLRFTESFEKNEEFKIIFLLLFANIRQYFNIFAQFYESEIKKF